MSTKFIHQTGYVVSAGFSISRHSVRACDTDCDELVRVRVYECDIINRNLSQKYREFYECSETGMRANKTIKVAPSGCVTHTRSCTSERNRTRWNGLGARSCTVRSSSCVPSSRPVHRGPLTTSHEHLLARTHTHWPNTVTTIGA